MVRGEEAVATADENMGEADGGRGRRRARRRIASGGRGRPWTTAPTTPSRGGNHRSTSPGAGTIRPGGARGKENTLELPPAHSDVIFSSVSSDPTFCRSLFLCQCQCRCSCLPVCNHPPLPRLSGVLASSSLSLSSAAALATAAAAAEDAGKQRLAVVRGGEGVHAPSEA